jgi:hypothetical protein
MHYPDCCSTSVSWPGPSPNRAPRLTIAVASKPRPIWSDFSLINCWDRGAGGIPLRPTCARNSQSKGISAIYSHSVHKLVNTARVKQPFPIWGIARSWPVIFFVRGGSRDAGRTVESLVGEQQPASGWVRFLKSMRCPRLEVHRLPASATGVGAFPTLRGSGRADRGRARAALRLHA